MRAAIVTGAFPPSPESVATTVKHLVDEAVRRGHRPLVLTSGLGPPSYRGVPVARVRNADSVGRALAEHHADLVHVADPRLVGPGPLRAARRLGLPVVVSHHSIGAGPVADWWGSFSASGADLSLATCLAAQDMLRTNGEPAALWRAGVDVDLYSPTMRSAALVERWSRGGRLVVGHVGPVDKNAVLRRLAAVSALDGVRLVALRAGTAGARLRAKAPRAQVIDEMSGVDLAHALASCDLVVQPRHKDLDGHGPRRALAAGVPVVGFAAGGLPDVVADGCNGLLVDPGEADDLLDAVRRLRDERDRLEALATRSRASGTCRSWSDAYDELVDVHYARVLPGTRSGADRRFGTGRVRTGLV